MIGFQNTGFTSFNINDLIDKAKEAPTKDVSIEEFISFGKHQHDIENSKQNMEERKHYAECIFIFTCLWCIILIIIVVAKGRGNLHLSDEIVLALIGSTTLNVFVFFQLVTKYLFNSDKST